MKFVKKTIIKTKISNTFFRGGTVSKENYGAKEKGGRGEKMDDN